MILRNARCNDEIHVYRSSCKVPVIPLRLKWNLNFLDIFSKNTQISNFKNIRPGWSRVVPFGHLKSRTDRQTDMKLIVVFRNFANAFTNCPT